MEAPEKVWINKDHAVYFQPQKSGEYIGYTRTDVIIEKALKFLDGCIPDYIDLKHANVDTFMSVDNDKFIEDFKNYMKR